MNANTTDSTGGPQAQVSLPPAPQPITGSATIHMFTRIRTSELVVKPQRSLILPSGQGDGDSSPTNLENKENLYKENPSLVEPQFSRNSSTSSTLVSSSPASPGLVKSTDRSPSSVTSRSPGGISRPATRSPQQIMEGMYQPLGVGMMSRTNSPAHPNRVLPKPRLSTAQPQQQHSSPKPTINTGTRPKPGAVFMVPLNPMNPSSSVRPPLPPPLPATVSHSSQSLSSTPSPNLASAYSPTNTPVPLPHPRKPSPPTLPLDQSIAFHLKASIDEFTTTASFPIGAAKVNDLSKRASLFYFLEIQHQILMHEWSNMHDGYGNIKMAHNSFMSSTPGATTNSAPSSHIPSWNTITAQNLKSHHPTAPTKLNYLPPTIHLAMPNGRDVGALVEWILTHNFSEDSTTLTSTPVHRLALTSRKLLSILNNPYDSIPRELRFLHLVQTANRLGLTDAANLSTLMNTARPESMYFTLSESHIHYPIYTPLSSWMLENWHTTAFSHPHFATALLHAPTSGIDESLIIRLSLLFQKSKNPHAAFWMLLHWSGAKDPSALKTLADRVADVASTMQGSTEPMLGHEIAKLIRERVWAWERELNMGTLIEQDERLEAGERELEELERIAAERMGEIERVVEEVKRLEVEGLVAFQRKEYVAEKREKRGRILGDGVDTVERQHTYDSDETAVNSGEVSSEEESGSGTGRKLELLMKQSFEAFQDESDSESMVLPPCCSPPPPPPSSYFEASSIFTRRENSGDSAAASEIDFDPSVLVLLNQSSDNRVSISKHFSKDVDVDSSFEDLNGYKSIRRESVDSIADNVSILSLSSVTSTALFSPLTPHTNRLRPTSSCPTANDHTVSGFFDYLYTPQASPTTPVAPSNSATYEKDWNQDEDIHEEHSANDEPERAEEKWIASVAHWEYDNWKKQVFKMKNAYVELPSPTTADGGSFDGCMKLAPRDEFETDATGGVGAGPFGGSFEDEEGEDKGKGVLGGLLKRFKSTGGKAQLQKRQAELNARSEQEFCWDEEVVKGGDVDGDTVVASVLIVRDVAGSIINSTIYPRRL